MPHIRVEKPRDRHHQPQRTQELLEYGFRLLFEEEAKGISEHEEHQKGIHKPVGQMLSTHFVLEVLGGAMGSKPTHH